mgnify:CR=1 FL=1
MGLFHSPSIIRQDLTFLLDAANTKSYSGSGSTWTDISGKGNNGTLTNTGNIAHETGSHLKFNEGNTGGTGYVEMGTVVESADKYTKNIWFRTNAANTNNLMSGTGAVSTVFWTAGTEYRIYAGHGLSYYQVDYNPVGSGTGLRDWHNACVTYGSTTLKLYVNGKLEDTASSSDPSNFTLHIGAYGNANELSGDVAYASLYNRTLTDAEVKQNFEALRGRFGI